jgi:alpha-L-fucosidase
MIGHRQLIRVPVTTAQHVRFVIDAAAACPAISEVGLHHDPDAAVDSDVTVSANRPAAASNVHGEGTVYGPDKALDDDLHTRWATGDSTRACWLSVDLESPQKIDRVRIDEFEPRIEKFAIEVRDSADQPWRVVHTGAKVGKKFEAKFKPVTARHVRLNILEANFAPTIWEFSVYPAR